MGFLLRTLITAVAFWVAANLVDGIAFSGPGALILAAVVFGLVNALIRPIVALLSLPLTLLTFGLFALVINAAMFALTALVIPGMMVASFGAAFLGALIVALIGWVANKVIA